jgi:glycosyltransferase involved in cell wall biosynthesis
MGTSGAADLALSERAGRGKLRAGSVSRMPAGGSSRRTDAETLRVRLTPEAFAKPPGGVRRSAVDLLAALRALGVDVSVLRAAERSLTSTSPAPSALRRVLLQVSEAGYFATHAVGRGKGIAHSLYYDQQVRAGGWPLVVTVHDMVHERYGEGSRELRWAKRAAVKRASLIITPSRSSASDVARFFPDARAKILTIPWGVAPHFLSEQPKAPPSCAASPFLLYVGARRGYKNFSVLARALALSRHLDALRLVLVGGEAFDTTECAALGAAARDRLVHVPSASDEVLRALYDAAAALVVTSRCEGFGLPLLEAMARGCPVACAEGGASTEVAAGHAATFPPDSAEACAEAITRAIGLTPRERGAGRLHARRFDWRTSAEAHVRAYRSLMAAAGRRPAS